MLHALSIPDLKVRMSVSSEKFELAADDLDSALERVAASIDNIDNRQDSETETDTIDFDLLT